MNTDGYPFNLFGIITFLLISTVFTSIFWPLLEYFGGLTGTGWIGGIALGGSITLVAFINVAREYSNHRENLPEHP